VRILPELGGHGLRAHLLSAFEQSCFRKCLIVISPWVGLHTAHVSQRCVLLPAPGSESQVSPCYVPAMINWWSLVMAQYLRGEICYLVSFHELLSFNSIPFDPTSFSAPKINLAIVRCQFCHSSRSEFAPFRASLIVEASNSCQQRHRRSVLKLTTRHPKPKK